jgi:cysteinyl-tRNA synthetase
MQLLIDVRQIARKSKQFEIADTVRDRLGEIGIVLEDHPQGTIWMKKDNE